MSTGHEDLGTPPPQGVPATGDPPPHRDRRALVWILTLCAGLLAGLGSWFAGERTFTWSRPSEKELSEVFSFSAMNRAEARHAGRNGAVVYGTLGGLLGLALGCAGGLSRGSVRGTVTAGGIGVVLGAAVGALSAFGVMPWQRLHKNDDPGSLTLMPILLHCALWIGLGASAGLAFGIGRGNARLRPVVQGLFGGLLGALLGTLLHEVVVAIAFPMVRTDETFASTAVTRLLPHVLVALGTAAGAVWFVKEVHGRDPGLKPSVHSGGVQ